LFGLDIITKPGLLVFSHDFVKNWLQDSNKDKDLDQHASLITAALTALRETQRETITAIRQVGYTLLLFEGVLTYGILTTTEYDPNQYDFLKKIVLKFELMFTHELHVETFVNRADFEVFREMLVSMYDEMHGIDILGLRNILDVMKQSKMSNYIIFETSLYQSIFTSIVDPKVNLPIHKLTKIFREINDLCNFKKSEVVTWEISFTDVILHAIRIPTHIVTCLCPTVKTDKNYMQNEVKKIMNSLLMSPLIQT
jgi:hypothetical protein